MARPRSSRKGQSVSWRQNLSGHRLLRGLEVEVEGRGDNSGALVAEKIKFTNDDFGVARSLERASPPSKRV